MGQILLITLKELRAAVRAPRFVMVMIVVLPVFLGVAMINYHEYAQQLEAYEVSLKQQAEGFSAIKDYWRLMRSFITAFRPPDIRTVIAAGVMRNLDDTFFMYNVNNPPDLKSLLVRNSFSRMYGHWDLGSIVAIIISLLSLVLSSDALCGEKLNGTSLLLFSAPARRSTIVFGKIGGIFLTIAIPIAIACILCALAGYAMVPAAAGLLLPGLAAFTLLTLALAFAFVVLGVTLSIVVHKPLNALALSLLSWLVLVFAVPQVATAVASTVSPSFGQAEVDRRGDEMVNRYLAGFQKFKMENTAESRLAFRRYWFELTRNYQNDLRSLAREIDNRIRRQEYIAAAMGWLSPAFGYSLSLAGMCRTDPDAELDTAEDVWRTTVAYNFYVEKKLMPDLEKSLLGNQPMPQYENGIDWSGLPKPDFRSVYGSYRWEYLLHGVVLSLVWSAVLIGICLFSIRRFDPR